MTESTQNQLKGLQLSASDLRELTDWPEALVEDYLNLLSNFDVVAAAVDPISGLSPSRLVATNAAGALGSVNNLSPFILSSSANRVTVANNNDGTVSLSLPQDIHTEANLKVSSVQLGLIAVDEDYTLEDPYSFVLAGGAVTISIPVDSYITQPGRPWIIVNSSETETLTVDPGPLNTINGESSLVLYNQYDTVIAFSDGANSQAIVITRDWFDDGDEITPIRNRDFRIPSTNQTNAFFLDYSADTLGIGVDTTLTEADLLLTGSANPNITLTTAGGRTVVLQAKDSEPYCSVGTTTSHTFQLVTANTRRVSVGLDYLRVEAGVDFHVEGSTGVGYLFYCDEDNDRVGILNSAPVYELDIELAAAWNGIAFARMGTAMGGNASSPTIHLVRPSGGGTTTYNWYIQSGSDIAGANSSAFGIGYEVADNGSQDITNAISYMLFNPNSAVVFNTDQQDIDFIVKSTGNASMLKVDAGYDVVGIGGTHASYPLNVEGNTRINGTLNVNNAAYMTALYIDNANDGGVVMNTSSGRFYMAPYFDSAWQWGYEFGFDTANERWYFEPTVYFGGRAYFESDVTTLMSSDSNEPRLQINNTNADGLGGEIRFYKNSASPADYDWIGEISWWSNNSTPTPLEFFNIRGMVADVTAGTEDCYLIFDGMNDGANIEWLRFQGSAGIFFNYDNADVDFAVCTTGSDKMLFVNAGSDVVDVIGESTSTAWVFRVTSSVLDNYSGFWANSDDMWMILRDSAGAVGAIIKPESQSYVNHGLIVNEGGNSSDFRVESTGNAYAFHVDAGNNRLGILTTATGGYQIKIIPDLTTDDIGVYIQPTWEDVTSNQSVNQEILRLRGIDQRVDAGFTESGARYGARIDMHTTNGGFAGTLNNQYGMYIYHGTYGANPTGTINSSYGLYVSGLYGSNSTVTQTFGVYITAQETGGTQWGIYQNQSFMRNYFNGAVGIGTGPTSGKLHVLHSTVDEWAGYIYNNYNGAGKGLAVLAGDGSSDTPILRCMDRSTSTKFTVQDDGNVGINLTSPETALHAYHATDNIVATIESGDSAAWVEFKDSDTSGFGPLIGTIGNTFYIYVDSAGARYPLRVTDTAAAFNVQNEDLDFYVGSVSYDRAFFVDANLDQISMFMETPEDKNTRLYIYGDMNSDPGASTAVYIQAHYREVTSNQTDYQKGVYILPYDGCDISAGVTESGYRIALDASNYYSAANFEGTLNNQYAIWARAGTYSSNPTGTITTCNVIYAEGLYGANTTITNMRGVYIDLDNTGGTIHGIYQKDDYADNYFAGNIGIGTSSPETSLDIVGTRAEQLRISDTTTNATQKIGYIQGRHYTNAEEDFCALVIDSYSGSNVLRLGGGASGLNTATHVKLYAAANSTTTTGTAIASFTSSNIIFNEDGDDVDFRVESDAETHCLFVDASTNSVGIRTSATSDGYLTISGVNPTNFIRFLDEDTSNDWRLRIDSNGGFNISHYSDTLASYSYPFVIEQDLTYSYYIHIRPAEVVINQNSEDVDFRVESSGRSNMFFVDGGNDKVYIGQSSYRGTSANFSLQIQDPGRVELTAAANGIMGCFRPASSTTNSVRIDADPDDAAAGSYVQIIVDGSVDVARFYSDEIVFNEGGADIDFRVESDTLTHALFVDGSSGYVGIGKVPGVPLNVYHATINTVAHFESGDSMAWARWTDVNTTVALLFGASADTLNVNINSTSIAVFSETDVVINEASGDIDFRVESNANTHMLFVDAGVDVVSIGTGTFTSSCNSLYVSAGNGAGDPLMVLENPSNDSAARGISLSFGFDDGVGAKIYSHRPIGGAASDATLSFYAGGNNYAGRIDSDRCWVINQNSQDSQAIGGITPIFQIMGDSSSESAMVISRYQSTADGPEFRFAKSRSASWGNTTVADADILGTIAWHPADGVDFATVAAKIYAQVTDSGLTYSTIGTTLFFEIASGYAADLNWTPMAIRPIGSGLFTQILMGDTEATDYYGQLCICAAPANYDYPHLQLVETAGGGYGCMTEYYKDSTDPDDTDVIAGFRYYTNNDAGTPEKVMVCYEEISVTDVTDGSEDFQWDIGGLRNGYGPIVFHRTDRNGYTFNPDQSSSISFNIKTGGEDYLFYASAARDSVGIGLLPTSYDYILDVLGDVRIDGALEVVKRVHLTSTETDERIYEGAEIDVMWNVQESIDSTYFTHSTSTNKARITVEADGVYHLIVNLNFRDTTASNRNTPVAYVKVNGVEVATTRGYSYDRGLSYGEYCTVKIVTVLELEEDDYIEIWADGHNVDATPYIDYSQCELHMWRL
jgi:hypothetical protein